MCCGGCGLEAERASHLSTFWLEAKASMDQNSICIGSSRWESSGGIPKANIVIHADLFITKSSIQFVWKQCSRSGISGGVVNKINNVSLNSFRWTCFGCKSKSFWIRSTEADLVKMASYLNRGFTFLFLISNFLCPIQMLPSGINHSAGSMKMFGNRKNTYHQEIFE